MAIIFAPVASIRIVRGTAWNDDLQLVDAATKDPINLTGVVRIISRVRKTINGPILLELSTTNGNLEIVDAATGKIGFRISTADSLSLPQNNNKKAKYIYDALIERTTGEYEAAAKGTLTVLPQITRPTETT